MLISTLVALTLSPAMCSVLLRSGKPPALSRLVDAGFAPVRSGYRWLLGGMLAHKPAAFLVLISLGAGIYGIFTQLPSEYTPPEDRRDFRVAIRGPEGASFEQTKRVANQVEEVLVDFVERGEAQRVLVRVPGSFGAGGAVNSGWGTVLLHIDRPGLMTTAEVMAEARARFAEIPGFRIAAIPRSGLFRRSGEPVQFVLTGATFEELVAWRDVILERARENPGLRDVDSDYKETNPQIQVYVDTDRAGSLGVAPREVGRTLETLMGQRRVTTYVDGGEEYDVILEADKSDKRSARDLENTWVRSDTTGELIPLANLVRIEPLADSAQRNRFNRLRAITITANLADGYTLGEALDYLNGIVKGELGGRPGVAYKGMSREFVDSSGALYFTFGISLLLVFLVLAAQFESFLQPLVILSTVPLAVFGGLLGLELFGESLNIYSRIALVILIGLATKNGILIVEFANQLRDEGRPLREAILEASALRLRPILMTGLSTALGALPLVLFTGAGGEARFSIGVVVLSGVSLATLTTLLIVPPIYELVGRFTGSPEERSRKLRAQLEEAA